MQRISVLFFTAVLLLVFYSSSNGQSASNEQEIQNAPPEAEDDYRQLVSMPAQAQKLMREDMLDHLAALNEIIGLLAVNNLDSAADVAETRMGKSAMGKHRATGMGPGRFMPLEMRKIGWSMHESASRFALIAKEGDLKKAYDALQKVTSSCVACHYSYRTR